MMSFTLLGGGKSIFRPTLLSTLSRLRTGSYGASRGFLGMARGPEVEWQPRNYRFDEDKTEEYNRHPMVTAQALRHRKVRPTRVKMLVRDYVDDALYNPHYGYFSKEAVIFTPGEPFDFRNMKDSFAFQEEVGRRYTAFENDLDLQEYNEIRQLWHTPTEMFKPFYGEAIARYLVANYKLTLYPYDDLIIYEMGAGNGTLMRNILDYIEAEEPDVYQRTKYKVIEITPKLAELQRKHMEAHPDTIEIINKSIFDWDVPVMDRVYFLALEVFDNFAHDMIRYDLKTNKPHQGVVLIDKDGEFYEFYTPELDSLAERYLNLRSTAVRRPRKRDFVSKLKTDLRQYLPFPPNLSEPEFIPTNMMLFFEMLRDKFPKHKLLASDFHSLPDAIEGINAPVVQTRYKRTTVPVSTLFVQQGYFDILFPTDFQIMEDIYQTITGKLTKVMTHGEFMEHWADVDATKTKSGENPLLTWYENASIIL